MGSAPKIITPIMASSISMAPNTGVLNTYRPTTSTQVNTISRASAERPASSLEVNCMLEIKDSPCSTGGKLLYFRSQKGHGLGAVYAFAFQLAQKPGFERLESGHHGFAQIVRRPDKGFVQLGDGRAF